ncbi:MAG: NAD(P)H-dependent oxidoreductase [Deltaproteobacteria bacterium]
MKHLLVLYHSQGGGAQRMAEAVLRGARREEAEVEVRERHALEGTLDDLLWADAVIFGTPENFGTMSGALKYFFDETFYPAQGKVQQKPYALFVKCGNDGSGAVREVDRIALGYPMRRVAEPVLGRGELDEEILSRCEELGQTLAAGLAMGLWS